MEPPTSTPPSSQPTPSHPTDPSPSPSQPSTPLQQPPPSQPPPSQPPSTPSLPPPQPPQQAQSQPQQQPPSQPPQQQPPQPPQQQPQQQQQQSIPNPNLNPTNSHPSYPQQHHQQQQQQQQQHQQQPIAFSRPAWSQPTSQYSHFSSQFQSSTSSSAAPPPPQRGGIAIGVPAHASSGPTQPAASFSSAFGVQYGAALPRNPVSLPDPSVVSSSSPSPARPIMHGMPSMGIIGSQIRPGGVPPSALHQQRPMQAASGIRPLTTSNNMPSVTQSCQVDLVKVEGRTSFIRYLDSLEAQPEHRAMDVFVLAIIVDGHKRGQEACMEAGLLDVCLQDSTPNGAQSEPLLLQWLCLCLVKMWEGFKEAQIVGLHAGDAVISASLLSKPQF